MLHRTIAKTGSAGGDAYSSMDKIQNVVVANPTASVHLGGTHPGYDLTANTQRTYL